MGVKSPFFKAWFGDWRIYDNSKIKHINLKDETRGIIKNLDTNWEIIISRQVSKETMHQSSRSVKNAVKYLPYIKDITQNAVLLNSETSDSDNGLSIMYHTLYAYTEKFGYPSLIKLRVEELANEKSDKLIRRDYLLQSIEEELLSERNRLSTPNRNENNSSISSIADLVALVKENDKTYNPKLVNRDLLNEDGTPKIFYYGTQTDNGEFYTFDETEAKNLGKGNYFTTERPDGTENDGGSAVQVYLKIEKPFVFDGGTGKSIFGQFEERHGISAESYDELRELMQEKGYDGVIQYTDSSGGMTAVVFDSRQEGKNYYKVHRLLMPDGSQFIFNTKRDTAERAGGVNNNSGLSPTDNVSDNSIPDSSENVNIKNTAGKGGAGDTAVNNGASEKAENSAGKFSVASSNGSPEVRNYETGAAAGPTVDSAGGAQYNETVNGSQSGIDAADGAYNIGSSGWLENGGRRPSGKAVERFGEEYFVRLSEKPVSAMDTAGRRLSLELQRRLNNTALKNSDGSVLSLYHWTSHKFKVFAKGELGFHFGTFKAAQKRKSDLSEGTDGYYKEVYLNIKNPIYFKEDNEVWKVVYIARRLYKMHIINGLEHERTRECKGFYSTDYGSEAAVELRAILKNKGYDGIVYYNQYEGDFSVIAFDPEQVITVAENGITAEEAGVTWPEENYKGDNYGNQDTGVLAGRGVSAFGGDRDGIRQQGENSQILYEFLAGDNGVRQRSRDTAPVKPNELYRLHKNTYELSDTAERENTFRLRESDAGDIRERRVNEDGEGERSHGNQDTGVLAGRGVSAFGGDRDGIRQQGENSAALYGFMEGNERGRQGSRDFAFGEQNGLYGKRNKRFGLSDTAERENTFRLRESDAGDIRERRVNEDAYGGGEKNAVPEQRGYSEDNGQRGETKGYQNAGAYKENERAWRESEEAFAGRVERDTEKAGRGRRILLRHNNSLLAYYEKQPDNTPAGRAVSRLRSYGVEAVYCDGALESNQSGITKRHTEALTAPDGTVFVSSLATLSEIEIASHEIVHSNERKETEAYNDYKSTICENLLFESEAYEDVCREINENHYGGKYDIENIEYAVKFIREIAAYLNEFIASDPDYAYRRFSGMIDDWEAVVRASEQFNRDIGADFTKSAFSLPESGNEYDYYDGEPDYEGESGGSSGAYSYEALTAKPDMKVTVLDGKVPANRADVVAEAKKNAASVGRQNTDGSVSVFVEDIRRTVVVSTYSIRHSLDRRMSVNAPVMLKIGDILNKSIKINELNPREYTVNNTYVLIGMAKNRNNEPYVVLFLVNSYKNEINSVDVLYSANAKREPAALLPRLTDASAAFTDSVISIAEAGGRFKAFRAQ